MLNTSNSDNLLAMKKVDSLLKGRHYICFLDFEGTQFSHEMIAIGAVLATLDKKNQIKKLKPTFKTYVKAKNKIGTYVTDLTGITEQKLKEDGVSFYKAINALRLYCGSAFKKCAFMTFGNHDLRILNQSIAYNLDTPKPLVSQIVHNYIDFASLISDYIRDDNGNPYSLVNYCSLFGLELQGIAHDPDSDALNLAYLYNAFLTKKEIVLKEYNKLLGKQRHLPTPIKKAIESLTSGKNYTVDEFKESLEEEIE